jgi:hypothetical protein
MGSRAAFEHEIQIEKSEDEGQNSIKSRHLSNEDEALYASTSQIVQVLIT